VKVEFIFIKFD